MNNIYKTVWNKAKRCLSVVSELAKSHGGSGTIVKTTAKKAFLLMSFAAMLAPQVYATEYVVSAGQTSGSIILRFGDTQKVYGTANGTKVNISGDIGAGNPPKQYVYTGGVANNTTVNGYGQQNLSGGTANNTTVTGWKDEDDTTIYSGTQNIFDGGIASNATINEYGVQIISNGGSAISTTVNSSGKQTISNAGSALNTTVSGGAYQYLEGGTASSTTLIGGGSGLLGLTAQATQDISDGGKAFDTAVKEDGYQRVSAGGSAVSTTISGLDRTPISGLDGGGNGTGGAFQLVSGGSADQTSVYKYGTQQVRNGGIATNTTIYDGGRQDIYVVKDDNAIASAYGAILSSGGEQVVSEGGVATSTTIYSGGRQTIDKKGQAVGTTINKGGSQTIIHSRGIASNTTIYSDGLQIISNGGNAHITTVRGGEQRIKSGTATSTTVSLGGEQVISSGKAVSTTVINGGSQTVYQGGVASHTELLNGYQTVSAGGKAFHTVISKGTDSVGNGGEQKIEAGGSATDTIISGMGRQYVYGTADNTTVTDGDKAVQYVWMGGVANNTVLEQDGKQEVSGGVANDTTVNFYGNQLISNGGTANSAIVNGGGTQQVLNGGFANNTALSGEWECESYEGENYYWDYDSQQVVYAGGTASGTTANQLGTQVVHGTADDTAVNPGGTQSITSGGVANRTILSGSSEPMKDTYGNSISGFWYDEPIDNPQALAEQHVTSGGTANDTTINEYGRQYVSEGGIASGTIINPDGEQHIGDGGTAYDTTVNNGGSSFISSGGHAEGMAVHAGGTLSISGQVLVKNLEKDVSGSITMGTAHIPLFPQTDSVKAGVLATGGLDAEAGSVAVSSGTVSQVYGGYSQAGSAKDNIVTITGDAAAFNVIGGYSTVGSAYDNSVTVAGGTVEGTVRGGMSPAGMVKTNKVYVKGGSVGRVIGGGGVDDGVEYNSVAITGGTVGSGAFGGVAAGAGLVRGNTVTVSGDSTAVSQVTGGQSSSGESRYNTVTVNGGSVSGDLQGGQAVSGAAHHNTVTVAGGSVSGGVFGGRSTDGTVNNNTVTLTGGTLDRYVRGGYSAQGAVRANTVTVEAGAVAVSNIHGGESASGVAESNTVTVAGGTVKGTVRGGMSPAGMVKTNKVYVKGGSVGRVIGGGGVDDGVEYNSVAITGGTVGSGAFGGVAAGAGLVRGNTVTVSGDSTAVSQVTGGQSSSGESRYNTVNLSGGGTVTGSVYGGYSTSGLVHHNTINLDDVAIGGTVYGGWANGKAVDTSNTITASGVNTVGGLDGYKTLTLAPGTANAGSSGQAVITVTGSSGADFNGKTIKLSDPDGLSDSTDKVSLLSATKGSLKLTGATLDKNGTFTDTSWTFSAESGNVKELSLNKGGEIVASVQSASPRLMMARFMAPRPAVQAGTVEAVGTVEITSVATEDTSTESPVIMKAMLADASAGTDGSEAVADNPEAAGTATVQTAAAEGETKDIVIRGTQKATENSKTLSEALLGTVALVNQGTEFIADQGMAAIDEASANGTSVFGAMHGGSSRYETGSHIDLDSVSLMAGVAAKPAANATLAGFVEAGWGNSKSHVSGAKGSGEHEYYGVGVAGKYSFDNPFYVDGSIRLGVAKTDFDGRYSGDKAHYKNESFYTAAHIGGGYVFNIGDKTDLDLYGRYAVTWLDGDDVRLHDKENTRFHMGSSTTHALRGGIRFTGEASDTLKWKAGLAYEHIFNGDAKGNINGLSLDTPSLQGNTAIGELGISMKPSANSPWTFDLTAKGYAGDRRGGAGSISAKYSF